MSASSVAGLLVVAVAVTARAVWRVSRARAVRTRLEGFVDDRRHPGGARLASLPDPPAWLGRWLQDAGVEAAPRVVWAAGVGGVAATALITLVLAGPATATLAGLLTTGGAVMVLRSRRGRGQLRLEADLPAALEAIARSLRSGASLRQAVAEAGAGTHGRLGRELLVVAGHVEEGAALVAALEALAVRNPAPGVRLAVAALCLGVETGGAQARAVDGVAATLRDRLAVAAEVRALSSQARISALVIGLAPLGFGGFAITTDRRMADFLFHTPLGLVLVALGVSLDGLGWLWMQRLARTPA